MAAQTGEERTRTNTFQLQPKQDWKRVCLIELLDSAAALVNIVTYHRRQTHCNPDKTRNDIWNTITKTEIRNRFQSILGRAITDKLLDKCDEMWDAFFTQLDDYHGDEQEDKPSPPGYWKEDGRRVLQTVVRNDAYTVEWGDHSRIELALGSELKEKYGIPLNQRLCVPIRGNPKWEGHGGRLELVYDRTTESFTAHQPVTFLHDTTTRAAASGDEDVVAAVDVGANNFVAVTTSNGHQVVFHARPLFHRFHHITERISELQSKLPADEYSSRLIERLYDKRRRQRDHAQDALVRHLARCFEEWGVGEVYIGKLDDVREKHWSVVVNEKTDLFWAHGRFRRRMHEVFEGECGITVEEESEAGTSSRCPRCGEEESIGRNGDVFQCGECGFEGHSDVVGSENFLHKVVDDDDVDMAGSMARPADSGQNGPEWGHRGVPRLEWDDHEWRRRGHSTKEEPANQSTTSDGENLAFGVSVTG